MEKVDWLSKCKLIYVLFKLQQTVRTVLATIVSLYSINFSSPDTVTVGTVPQTAKHIFSRPSVGCLFNEEIIQLMVRHKRWLKHIVD